MIDNCQTQELEYKTIKINSSRKQMASKDDNFISVRDFIRNFSSNIKSDKTYIITKNGTPIGTYSPYMKKAPRYITKSEMDKYFSSNSSGPKDLSDKHDKYLYSKDDL